MILLLFIFIEKNHLFEHLKRLKRTTQQSRIHREIYGKLTRTPLRCFHWKVIQIVSRGYEDFNFTTHGTKCKATSKGFSFRVLDRDHPKCIILFIDLVIKIVPWLCVISITSSSKTEDDLKELYELYRTSAFFFSRISGITYLCKRWTFKKKKMSAALELSLRKIHCLLLMYVHFFFQNTLYLRLREFRNVDVAFYLMNYFQAYTPFLMNETLQNFR